MSLLLFISKKCASHFRRETSNENKQLKETKTMINNLYLSDKAFKGTVVNRVLPSWPGVLLEIMFAVPIALYF